MLPLLLAVLAADPVPVAGVWEGSIKAGAIPLKLQFTLAAKPDGTLGGDMVSLDQGAAKVPCKEVELADDTLTLKLPAIAATFTGTLAADGKTAKGSWKQGGQSFPLTLTRVDKPTTRNRPQTAQAAVPVHGRGRVVRQPGRRAQAGRHTDHAAGRRPVPGGGAGERQRAAGPG